MSTIVTFEAAKIITKSNKDPSWSTDNWFLNLGSKAFNSALIPHDTKNNRAYSTLMSKPKFCSIWRWHKGIFLDGSDPVVRSWKLPDFRFHKNNDFSLSAFIFFLYMSPQTLTCNIINISRAHMEGNDHNFKHNCLNKYSEHKTRLLLLLKLFIEMLHWDSSKYWN